MSDIYTKQYQLKSLRILHIEDSQDHQLLMRHYLREIPWNIDYQNCSTLSETHDLLNSEDVYFDLVLMDYMLKGEVSSSLIEKFPSIPVVIITAHDDEELDQKLMKMGAADFVSKSDLSSRLLKRIIRHAIERQSILNRLAHESTHDSLTELYNRRFALQELERLKEEQWRHNNPFSLCMIDVDGLKSINDQHGHYTGDDAINTLADGIKNSLRRGDIGARLSGDEFLILFPNTPAIQARQCLSRVNQYLACNPLTINDQNIPISVSYGLMDYSSTMENTLLKVVDEYLYQAKTAGKNCLCENGSIMVVEA